MSIRNRSQALNQIGQEILRVFHTDTDSQEILRHGRVGHGAPFDQALDPAEAGCVVEEEQFGRQISRIVGVSESEGKHRSVAARHLLSKPLTSSFRIGIGFEAGVVNLSDHLLDGQDIVVAEDL